MTFNDKIRREMERVARIDTEHSATALEHAHEWLAAGGYSQYSNQDFDVLQQLISIR